MRCSIIIPTTEKTLDYLLKCVSSVQENSKEYHDIIIVSNAGAHYEIPTNGSDYIKRFHHEERGMCKAFNFGVEQMDTKYGMLVDDDFVFPPGWEKILDKLEETDERGNVTEKKWLFGQLVEPGRRGSSFIAQDFGDTLEEFNEEGYRNFILEKQQDKIQQGFGFPILFTKQAWKEVEGYDEVWDPYGSNSDSDLEYKIMLAGYPMEQYLGSLFYHFQSKSAIFSDEQEAQEMWQRNTNHFPRKWGFGRPGSPKIWSTEFIIPFDKLAYKPAWAKFENNPHIQVDETFNEATECGNCRYNYLNFKNPGGCPKCVSA